MNRREFIIGIDEAGRGPLAGPVSVGAVMVRQGFDFERIRGVRDSKQLSPESRAQWYERLLHLEKEGLVWFAVSFASARTIDRRGIMPAIRAALGRCLRTLRANSEKCEVLLDGSLHAPAEFRYQKTIIRGDITEPLISLASIAAKVERDRHMQKIAQKYPAYDFQVHKGYGTLGHRRVILEKGLCEIHRTTFCRNLLSRY